MAGAVLTVALLWGMCSHLAPAQTLLAGNVGRPPVHHHAQTRHVRSRRRIAARKPRPARHPRPRRVTGAAVIRPGKRLQWTVRIPSIGVNARLMVLGAPASRYLPIPPLSAAFRVGWYDFTSVPGQPGNAVLAGHVDTYLGPAVFYNLYLLRPGNKIYIQLGKHEYTRYTVTGIRELPKADFPANQIFGTTNVRRLWLITCGGPFDYATRHYLDNIVVSASQ